MRAMPQDTLQAAKEAYSDVKEAWRENHLRMLEDLRFSNPAEPQQWDKDAIAARQGRVRLTLDRTNPYIGQVVNSGRQNKPAINTVPVDSRADVAVSTVLDGMIRHIEYRSRAQIAYDTALEGAARCGVGWIRVIPKVVDAEVNQQEICIARVADHLSCMIDGSEPDGSDALNGFAESLIPKRQFQREYPKASTTSWESSDGNWVIGDNVRICERQYIVEEKANWITVRSPEGQEFNLSEDDYWQLAKQVGFQPEVVRQYEATTRTVKWCKFNGAEMLEETVYPGKWLGIIPVYGFELSLEGKRYLCGLTRRMMDAQRAYNYERSALVETVAMQPKAPVLAAARAIQNHQSHWKDLNKGQPAYLPYDDIDAEGNPVPPPQRLAPPAFPAAFAQGGQMAVADLEAAIGMSRSNLGMPNNATSGRQERERKLQGDTATFHFPDNLSRSIEHTGRVVVGQIPLIYDTKRQAKILGIDGQQSEVTIDPDLSQPAVKRGSKVVAINPGVGTYDVRVQAGPSYTTQREEAADGIEEALRAAPNFAPVLVPALVKLRDWPEAEKISRMLLAMAPPEVQKIANEGINDEPEIPPAVAAKLRELEQQSQQMSQMLDAGEKELARLQAENERLKGDKGLETAKLAAQVEADEANESINRYKAETDRLKVVGDLLTRAPALPAVEPVPGDDSGAMPLEEDGELPEPGLPPA